MCSSYSVLHHRKSNKLHSSFVLFYICISVVQYQSYSNSFNDEEETKYIIFKRLILEISTRQDITNFNCLCILVHFKETLLQKLELLFFGHWFNYILWMKFIYFLNARHLYIHNVSIVSLGRRLYKGWRLWDMKTIKKSVQQDDKIIIILLSGILAHYFIVER